jgi:hypothetical protein
MKKEIKKLNLSKRTIANLTTHEMRSKIGAGHTRHANCGGGGNSQNCTLNQNTCPGHDTCYNCFGIE